MVGKRANERAAVMLAPPAPLVAVSSSPNSPFESEFTSTYAGKRSQIKLLLLAQLE